MKPTKEQIDDYLKHSGDNELPAGKIEANEHGFCIWRLNGNAFVIAALYGDGKYWNPWADEKARNNGMKQIILCTKRNPETIVRKYQFTITGYILAREVL